MIAINVSVNLNRPVAQLRYIEAKASGGKAQDTGLILEVLVFSWHFS